jgi:hypothetical protein
MPKPTEVELDGNRMGQRDRALSATPARPITSTNRSGSLTIRTVSNTSPRSDVRTTTTDADADR